MMEYSSQLEQAENNVRVSIFGDDLKQLVEENLKKLNKFEQDDDDDELDYLNKDD